MQPAEDPELFFSIVENEDIRMILLKRVRSFDVKMLMDACTRLRHDKSMQTTLFHPQVDPKVKDTRVLHRFRAALSRHRYPDAAATPVKT
tara:strand:+ start:1451 stop:1720 length:270 start_codon:yes stop_codon:yes gene_type:complete